MTSEQLAEAIEWSVWLLVLLGIWVFIGLLLVVVAFAMRDLWRPR